MAYEMKQVDARGDLSPAVILQAKGEVISRNDVKNGGTLQVPVIDHAKVGDKLTAIVDGNGSFYGTVTYNEENLGKTLDFKVLNVLFSEGETITTRYILEQGGDSFPSPDKKYSLID